MNTTTSDIIVALLPVIILNGVTMFSWIIFAFVYRKRGVSAQVLERMHPSFIGLFLREWIYWFINPFLKAMLAMRLTPNMLTAISIVIGFISGYYYFAGFFAMAGWMLLISGGFDLLDGGIARLTNNVTKEGAFFDSCADRYTESAIFIGIALYFAGRRDIAVFGEHTWVIILALTLLAMSGSQLVSYAKARGEAVGHSTRLGLMQRAERIAVLSIASCFYPFTKIFLVRAGMDEHWPMIIAMAILAVFTNYSAISRVVIIFRDIRRSHGGNE